jgi:hypothetical protein
MQLMLDKHKYVFGMNSRKVIIENAFGSLKTKWHILKHFNLKVDRATRIVITYCILRNYWIKAWLGYPKGLSHFIFIRPPR